MPPPVLSLIVPTRGRPHLLQRFLDSLGRTTANPASIEIILVIDEDDRATPAIGHPRLVIRRVVGRAGRTMGELNTAGFQASQGTFVMLLNDDVIVRTRSWDREVLRAAARFPDQIVLVHVNDGLMRDHMCTFPLLSQRFCELVGGICPPMYHRYRIDDHIEDLFNMLAALGHQRTVYLPDVLFEHDNAVVDAANQRTYEPDPVILPFDAQLFTSLAGQRKSQVLRLIEILERANDPQRQQALAHKLTGLNDPFALRTPNRQLRIRSAWWKRQPGFWENGREASRRFKNCYTRGGSRGLIRAIVRRLRGLFTGRPAINDSPTTIPSSP